MTPAEMRRAADILTDQYRAASPPPWRVDDDDDTELRLVCGTALNGSGSWRSEDEIAHHDTGDYGEDEDTWREDPQYQKVRACFDLIVTLRPLAAHIVDLLRREADSLEAGTGAVQAAEDIAASILAGRS